MRLLLSKLVTPSLKSELMALFKGSTLDQRFFPVVAEANIFS